MGSAASAAALSAAAAQAEAGNPLLHEDSATFWVDTIAHDRV